MDPELFEFRHMALLEFLVAAQSLSSDDDKRRIAQVFEFPKRHLNRIHGEATTGALRLNLARQNQQVVAEQIRNRVKNYVAARRISRAALDHSFAVQRGEKSRLDRINENEIAQQTSIEPDDLWEEITWRIAPGTLI